MKAFIIVFLLNTFVVGKVKNLNGSGEIIRGGKSIRMIEGIEIENGDIIKAYKGSSFTIVLRDDSELSIRGETVLKIDETYLYKGTVLERLLKKVSIILGRIWFKMKEGAWLNVDTATIVVGVRGTEFETGVALDGSAYTEVEEGEVFIVVEKEGRLQAGERAVFDVIEGLKVESRKKPFNPNRWIVEKRKRFEELRERIRKRMMEIMERRLKFYEMKIKEIEESERKGEWEFMPEKSSIVELIEDGINGGVTFLEREGIKWRLKDRFEKLRREWKERRRVIRLRMKERKEEIKRRIEKRRKKIKERMERLRKKMRR